MIYNFNTNYSVFWFQCVITIRLYDYFFKIFALELRHSSLFKCQENLAYVSQLQCSFWKSVSWSISVSLTLRTLDKVDTCFRSFVDDSVLGCFAPHSLANSRMESDPLKCVTVPGLANMNWFSSGTPHVLRFFTSSSIHASISGVRRMDTFRSRLPLISILWKCWHSFCSTSVKASAISLCKTEVYMCVKLSIYAFSLIFETSPALRRLKSITSECYFSQIWPILWVSLQLEFGLKLLMSSVKGSNSGRFHFDSLIFFRAQEDTHSLHFER